MHVNILLMPLNTCPPLPLSPSPSHLLFPPYSPLSLTHLLLLLLPISPLLRFLPYPCLSSRYSSATLSRLRQSFVTFVLLAICGLVPFSPCPCFIVPPPLIRMAASIAPLGAQKLPKTLRSLLFGRTHYKVDLTGSHYQFFSRFASTLLQLSLPSVVDFRALLREDMIATSSDFLTHHPTAPKDLPTILLNSTLGDSITHFHSLGYYPSSQILAALRAIYHAKPRVLDAIENRFGKRTLSTLTSANRPFHVLEHVETLWLKHFATYLCQHADVASLIWLHDGVWLSPLPSPTILLAANRAASSHLGLEAPLVLKTTELAQAAQSAEAELLAGRFAYSGCHQYY